jgi:nodulation protein E
MGIVSALGRNVDEFWRALLEGRPGIGPITLIDMSPVRFQNGAQAWSFNSSDHFPLKEADFLDRFAQFAVVAARDAVRDAGLEWTPGLQERSGIVTGSCVGGKSSEDDGFQNLYLLKKPRVSPLTIAHGNRHLRPHLHHLHRLLFLQPRPRAGLPDGARRRPRAGAGRW